MMAFTPILGVLLSVITAVVTQGSISKVVDTAQGPVRGYLDPEGGVFAFYGVPYATAPTGTQRFKPPLPAQERLEILEAVETDIKCPQPESFFRETVKYQEDCLVANIFIPETDATNLPVLVHVHGGAYQVGNGLVNTPKQLVKTNKIIAISFNYRVGVHGFLCLGTEDVPGNAGLKDQVALLRWVKENVGNFGGNPNDVTFAGESAGSSSVDLLMLSKTTEGLFNKVIPQSGANVAAWSVEQDPVENARIYARKLNFTESDISALEEFYKTGDFEFFFTVTDMSQPNSKLDFVPCIERDMGQERILEEAPVDIIKNGNYKQVPLLYGFTDLEGLINVFNIFSWPERMNEKFADFLPPDMQFESEDEKDEVAQRVKEFYFGDKVISTETALEFLHYFTDMMFAYPMLRSVKLHLEAGHKQIYLYEYSYPKPVNLPGGISVSGATHCAQTAALFDENKNNIDEDYMNMKNVVRELWLNFITTGEPVPEGSALPAWPPVNSTLRAPHMSLSTIQQLQGAPLLQRAALWDEIYEHHYLAPLPPNGSSRVFVIGKYLILSFLLVLFVL